MLKRNALVIGVLLLSITLSTGSISAKVIKVGVEYESSSGCVTRVTVDPKEVEVGAVAHRLRLGNTKVDWNLSASGDPVDDVEWSVQQTAATYETCDEVIPYDQPWRCNLANSFLGNNTWTYTIVASKGGCATAAVDPEVRFRKGFGGLVAAALLLVAVGAGAVVVTKKLTGKENKPPEEPPSG